MDGSVPGASGTFLGKICRDAETHVETHVETLTHDVGAAAAASASPPSSRSTGGRGAGFLQRAASASSPVMSSEVDNYELSL